MSRPRARTLAIGAALLLMLAALPFVPRGDDDQGAIRPSGKDQVNGAPPGQDGRHSRGSPRRCRPRSTGSSTPVARSAG